MEPETDTWASGILGEVGNYRLTFGNMAPRCGSCGTLWNLEDLFKIADRGDAKFSCNTCGAISGVRKPPDWFNRVIPFAVLLVGETAPNDDGGAFKGGTDGISIWCYHCGGPLPLDGSSRTVKCRHCGQDLLIPDDIWQRLHPVAVAHPWYIILDTGDVTALLPEDIDDFIDLAALPDGDTALIWEQDSEGCIGRADRTGGFRWLNRNITCSDYARLLYAPGQDLLWVIDRDEDIVQAFHADTGSPAVAIKKKKNKPGFITAIDHEGIAINTDGTLLVYRCWEDDNYALRRFDEKGKRIRLWPDSDDAELHKKQTEWETLGNRPSRPPEGAWITGGPDNMLYFIDRVNGCYARFDRQGTFQGLIRPDCEVVAKIQDCGISGDGSVFVLFDHTKKINHINFSHVGRIKPDGSFKVLAGPHAKENRFSLGTDMERMSVAERGEMHICNRDFDNFRILAPDGSLIWRSPGTVNEDQTRADELAEALGEMKEESSS
ncbi:MAG: hypothetical protein A2176_07025 [Spirochaetes bacterium RBG_13_51_14]|nr:MAG: hypothetical protein A2176_07025 [Spirochaetes bacterium RBG_13_51_14]